MMKCLRTNGAALAASSVILATLCWAAPAASEPPVEEPATEEVQGTEEAAAEPNKIEQPAPDWATTFDADAVNSYVTSSDAAFIVVAAGEREASRPAAQGLASALRVGSAKLVMNDQSLGAIGDLEDAAIVEKAKNLPVDHVAVVRVFDAAPGAPQMVVVVVYNKAGESLWALSGTAGQALEPSPEPQGVSVKASRSVAEVSETQGVSSEKARKAYDEGFIGFTEYAGMDGKTGAVRTSLSAYQGKYREPLEGRDFYEALGRPDLAEEYDSNRNMSIAGNIMGWGGYAGFMGFGLWAGFEYIDASSDNVPLNSPTTLQVLTGVSFVSMIVGYLIIPSTLHPVTPSEARRLAGEHNDKLKDDLGISADYSPFSAVELSPPSGFTYDFDLVLQNNGAQFVFRLDF